MGKNGKNGKKWEKWEKMGKWEKWEKWEKWIIKYKTKAKSYIIFNQKFINM